MSSGQVVEETTHTSHPEKIRAAALLALLAAAAVFTTLGIEGETLERVIRNDPRGTSYSIGAVIFGLSLPLLTLAPAAISGKNTSPGSVARLVWATRVSSLLVLGGLLSLVSISAASLHEREMPTLSTVATKASSDTVTIKYKAVAPSLRSNEKVLLKVVALRAEVEGQDLPRLCLDPGVLLPNTDHLDPDFRNRRILHWGESGPNRVGEATVAMDVSVSNAEFRYVCAFTTLFNTPEDFAKDLDYFSWSVTDLLNPLDETQKSPNPTDPANPAPAPAPDEAAADDLAPTSVGLRP